MCLIECKRIINPNEQQSLPTTLNVSTILVAIAFIGGFVSKMAIAVSKVVVSYLLERKRPKI